MYNITHILTSNDYPDKVYANIEEWTADHGFAKTDSTMLVSGTLELINETEVQRVLSYESEAARKLHKEHIKAKRVEVRASATWEHPQEYKRLSKVVVSKIDTGTAAQ
jgi:uncharacterized protein (DUF111 family)